MAHPEASIIELGELVDVSVSYFLTFASGLAIGHGSAISALQSRSRRLFCAFGEAQMALAYTTKFKMGLGLLFAILRPPFHPVLRSSRLRTLAILD